MTRFFDALNTAIDRNNSLLCVGLDPVIDKMPEHLRSSPTAIFDFNKAIIDATADLVCAYKPNIAFYSQYKLAGLQQLEQTIAYIKQTYPEIPVILDSKRGDIGNTNTGYASEAFDWFNADAVTVSPYMGIGSLAPLFERTDKGIVVLCRTSNEEAAELQNIRDQKTGASVYSIVADSAKAQHDKTGNVLLVVGATNPDELAAIRAQVGPEMVFLVPGIGAQGGDVQSVMAAGLGANQRGMVINSSREVLYAGSDENFALASQQKASETRDKINQYR